MVQKALLRMMSVVPRQGEWEMKIGRCVLGLWWVLGCKRVTGIRGVGCCLNFTFSALSLVRLLLFFFGVRIGRTRLSVTALEPQGAHISPHTRAQRPRAHRRCKYHAHPNSLTIHLSLYVLHLSLTSVHIRLPGSTTALFSLSNH